MENQKLSFNRRKFLINAAKVAGVGAVGYVYSKGCNEPEPETVAPIKIRHYFLTKPYLHSLTPDSMTVRWLTHKKSYSWVEYGEDRNLNFKMHAVTDGLVNAYNQIHEIILQNLKPGTTYYYRVASKEILEFKPYSISYGETIFSEVFSFQTMPVQSDEASWLILNDIHDTPQSFSKLIKLNKKEPFDFVFLNGDIFNNPENEGQVITYLLEPATEVFASEKPMILLRGNHEARGSYARELKQYFSYPTGYYFTFKWGPVFAIALDTGEDKEDSHAEYSGIVSFNAFREQQARWLEKVMQTEEYQNATYKVVMMHIPPHYSVGAKGELHCREIFSPLFDRYKVDIVISGHIHKHGVYPPVKGVHDYPIVIGGGPLPGTRTLIKVKANQQQLKLQMLDDSGKQVGIYTIKAK